jgi:hypothetical protein
MSCRRAANFLGAADAAARRLLASAEREDHPFTREDLLKAALIFACAGMDRTSKALVEEALPKLADLDREVAERFVKFASRRLAPGGSLDVALLSRLLLDPRTPRQGLLQTFVDDLTGDSMQSVQQLFRVFSALGLSEEYAKKNRTELARTFAARNQIVHEMDLVTEESGAHVRRARAEEDYLAMIDAALAVADHLIEATSELIYDTAAGDPFWAKVEEFKRPPKL